MPLQPDEIAIRFNMLPPEYKNGIMPNDMKAMQGAVEKAQLDAVVIKDPTHPSQKMKNEMQGQVTDIKNMENGTADSVGIGSMASKKTFNLSKFSQAQPFNAATPTDPFGAETSPAGVGAEQNYMDANQPSNNPNQFQDHSALFQELKSYPDPDSVRQANPDLVAAISGNETSQGAFDRFFSESNSEAQLDLAELIYEGLPPNMKNQEQDTSSPSNGMTIQAPYTQAGVINDYLNNVTAAIKEAADKIIKAKKTSSSKTFNLSKVAQHKGADNIVMWGPGQTRPDPFLRGQPVSDWHILERNKGFGQDIDGYWGVDWEAVWRGNVMDKYSRPYRDTTTGEWIGGYIQKRFEVDKNIPETNNYQLLPGERRKPMLPEYGSLESRLQSMRNDDDGHLGRVFNDTSKPFNWRKAQSAQNIKTAKVEDTTVAQLDVTTEKQLANAAQRPGVWDQPSIQRHHQEPPEKVENGTYKNNYGDPIKAAEAIEEQLWGDNLKKKVKPKMVPPIRR